MLTEDTNRKRIFDAVLARLGIRRGESAFSPEAVQQVKRLCPEILAFVRGNECTGERIHVLINVSGSPQEAAYEELKGRELIRGGMVLGRIRLDPWECAWVKEERL
jgi:sucrose phosphorylase